MKTSIATFLCIGILVSACDMLTLQRKLPESEGEKPIARVQNFYLYYKDIDGLIPDGISETDSVQLVNRHIKNWIKKHLMIAEAENSLNLNESELNRKVLDYKYALIVHEFEKVYINRQIDYMIPFEEIKQYYEENIENFELKQNIIRCNYIKLSNESPRFSRFRQLIRSEKPEDKEELKAYSIQFANKVHLDDSTWLHFDELIAGTPFLDVPNKVDFLRRNKFAEANDGESTHFLKVIEYRISKQTSPLEFVVDDIEKILINKRKVKLANTLEREIYEKAERNKSFQIYQPD
ncbi:MAG: peptidyl-prolyl cis-trans isomerase [Cyclobacteriaceae bacterium]|nr:peptidyl-prolyl cis-trans isomerase [Cyclobacteriaceae bacterium]